jgi:uncharacterized membrane protein YidH (DUF202 family)
MMRRMRRSTAYCRASRPRLQEDQVAQAVHFMPLEDGMKLIGVLLIVFGIVALVLGGIRYTTREKVLDIGPVEATTEKHHEIPLSPIVGVASVVGGIAVLVVGTRSRV